VLFINETDCIFQSVSLLTCSDDTLLRKNGDKSDIFLSRMCPRVICALNLRFSLGNPSRVISRSIRFCNVCSRFRSSSTVAYIMRGIFSLGKAVICETYRENGGMCSALLAIISKPLLVSDGSMSPRNFSVICKDSWLTHFILDSPHFESISIALPIITFVLFATGTDIKHRNLVSRMKDIYFVCRGNS